MVQSQGINSVFGNQMNAVIKYKVGLTFSFYSISIFFFKKVFFPKKKKKRKKLIIFLYENLEKSLLRSKVAEENSTSKNIYIMHIYLNWFISYSHLKFFRKSHYFSIIILCGTILCQTIL